MVNIDTSGMLFNIISSMNDYVRNKELKQEIYTDIAFQFIQFGAEVKEECFGIDKEFDRAWKIAKEEIEAQKLEEND